MVDLPETKLTKVRPKKDSPGKEGGSGEEEREGKGRGRG